MKYMKTNEKPILAANGNWVQRLKKLLSHRHEQKKLKQNWIDRVRGGGRRNSGAS